MAVAAGMLNSLQASVNEVLRCSVMRALQKPLFTREADQFFLFFLFCFKTHKPFEWYELIIFSHKKITYIILYQIEYKRIILRMEISQTQGTKQRATIDNKLVIFYSQNHLQLKQSFPMFEWNSNERWYSVQQNSSWIVY